VIEGAEKRKRPRRSSQRKLSKRPGKKFFRLKDGILIFKNPKSARFCILIRCCGFMENLSQFKKDIPVKVLAVVKVFFLDPCL